MLNSNMLSNPLLLRPAEYFVFKIASSTALLDVVLILTRGSKVDFPAYGAVLGLTAILMAIGFAYRYSGRSETIGSTATCAGLFILFTSALSLFNYLLLPNGRPTIDSWLAEMDSALGYHWPDAIALSAQNLFFNDFMRIAYLSTLPQIAVLVIVLGLTGRLSNLHALMVTVTISGMIAVIFWAIFPSLGPSALYTLSHEVQTLVRPVVGPSYGTEIAVLLREGSPFLSPNEIRGLIAFPSYHMVLALAATYYVRDVRWLFPFYLIVNLAVVPAVLVHGGHHLVDIPAGVAVFLLAAYTAQRMLAKTSGWTTQSLRQPQV